MAKYVKIIAKWKGSPRLLTRTFYFNISGTLEDLAYTILDLYEADFGHLFCFTDAEKVDYVTDMENSDHLKMANYRLDEIALGTKRTIDFTYDYGENYVFTVKVGTKLKKIEGQKICYPIKGKGCRIINDNSGLLYCYLKGWEINPEEAQYFDVPENRERFLRDLTIEEMEEDLFHEDDDIDDATNIDYSIYETEEQ